MVRVLLIRHESPLVAQQIHAIRMLAYQQEAELLGLSRFSPLDQTVSDILRSSDEFLGAYEGEKLVGVLSFGAGHEANFRDIASLVVHPAFQRRGVGRALVEAAIERAQFSQLSVQTAAANYPAVALYTGLRFKVSGRWSLRSGRLELVQFHRPPEPPTVSQRRMRPGRRRAWRRREAQGLRPAREARIKI